MRKSVIAKILVLLIFMISPIAYCDERYEKKVIFEITWDEFSKYDAYDFDNKDDVWFLDSSDGKVDVFDKEKKIIRSYVVPTKDPAQFFKNPEVYDPETWQGTSPNFNIRVDDCGNFVIFNNINPTKVLEYNSSGKLMKKDFFQWGRFGDVSYFDGSLYSRPDGTKICKLSPPNCKTDSKLKRWNNFLPVKKHLYTTCGLQLQKSGKILDFDDLKEKGSVDSKVDYMAIDIKGHIYVVFEFYLMPSDRKRDFYDTVYRTYELDDSFNKISVVPAKAERINFENGTIYSTERGAPGKNRSDFVFVKWEKTND